MAFAGGAFAATKDSHRDARQAFLNDVAKRLNVSPAQLNSALKGAAVDQLDAAVKAGKLTQAQANELKQHIKQGGGPGPLLFGAPGPGQGFRGPGLLEHGDGHGPLATAAKYLGLTKAQLRKQLISGKSLAQVAKAQGKSTSGLEQAITAQIKARLDKAVANKRITATQEQKLLSGLSAKIGDLINGTPPERARFGARGFGYHEFRGGFARPGSFAPAPPPPAAPAGPVA